MLGDPSIVLAYLNKYDDLCPVRRPSAHGPIRGVQCWRRVSSRAQGEQLLGATTTWDAQVTAIRPIPMRATHTSAQPRPPRLPRAPAQRDEGAGVGRRLRRGGGPGVPEPGPVASRAICFAYGFPHSASPGRASIPAVPLLCARFEGKAADARERRPAELGADGGG